MDLLIQNGTIIPCDGKTRTSLKRDLHINGKIIREIRKKIDTTGRTFDRIIDAKGKIVIPGLINAHMHSYANLIKGYSDTIPLELWMLQISAGGKLFEPEDNYYSALLGAAEMLLSGTTFCTDHLAQSYENLEAALKAYQESGMRVALAPMISDKDYMETLPLDSSQVPEKYLSTPQPRVADLLDTTVRLYKKWNNSPDTVRIFFGPSGPQRCSDELLKKAYTLAEEYETGFHTHVLESKIQAETGFNFYGKPLVLHLDALGVLSPRTALVHSVWLSKEESQVAAERGAVVIHNPASNLRLGSGTAPVNRFRKQGLRIALGTDGVNCGGSLSMFESMKLAAILHNPEELDPDSWIKSLEILEMATLQGAIAAGMGDKTGSLEEGKYADLVILNPRYSFNLHPLQKATDQIVYGETGSSVDTVIINGRIVVEERRIKTFDETRLFEGVQARADTLLKKGLFNTETIDEQISFLREKLWGEKK